MGAGVAVGAAVVAWGRVAAHVHHAQDVLAGLALGATAAGLGIWVVGRLLVVMRRRGMLTGHRALTTADRQRRAGS